MNIAKTNRLDWDDLRVFNAVVAAGSLRGAAELLDVNHSTVFRRLQRLEESIEARLFDRLPEGYTLTDAGAALREHSERIGDEVDALSLRLLGHDHRPSGTVRITAPDNIAYGYLPRHIESFRQSYPDVRIELVVGAASLDLSRREADIAVRATARPPEHLIGRLICRFPWGFYAGEAYEGSHGAPGDQNELDGHRLIGGDGAIGRLPALAWLERNAPGGIVARCNTLNGMAALALAGTGIALLPGDQQQPGLQPIFPLEPEVTSDLWILTHPELRRTERVRLLMRHLWEALRADELLPRQLPLPP